MRVAAFLLALLLLAGCADQATPDGTPEAQGPAVRSLRGVVVDDAIRPLANATVSLTGSDGSQANQTTPDNGEFEFPGLAAGAYVLTASRPGYFETQVAATLASDQDTPPVRLVLPVDAALAPAIEAFEFAGFLQCSVTAVAARAALCNPDETLAPICALPVGICETGPANLTQDRFLATHTLGQANLGFLQSELVWEDTSGGLGKNLRAIPGARTPSDGKIGDYRPFEGPSPLVMPMPGELGRALLLGNGRDYIVRVFSGQVDGSAPPCLPPPVNCQWGVGFVFQQRFDLYTHAFYNMVPGEGWQFGRDGVPPLTPP